MKRKLITERAFATGHRTYAQAAALAAAKDGDVAEADRMELLYLIGTGAPRPVPPEGVPERLLAQYDYALVPLQILHGGDVTQIRWGYQDHDEADPIWTFRTDTELNVVPDSIEDNFTPWGQWGGS